MMKGILIFFIYLASTCALQAECAQVINPEDIWDNSYIPCDQSSCYPSYECELPCTPCSSAPVDHIDGGYAFGRGIEVKKNYSYLQAVLFPFFNIDDKIPFLQVAAYRMSDHKWAGSIGLGFRWQPCCNSCDVYGINVFYDRRKCNQATYNQIGAGLESLSKSWEWRINGYMPVGSTSNLKNINQFDNYSGGFFIKVRRIEQAEYGADIEVGRNLYYDDFFRFYIGTGAGWFAGSYSKDNEWAYKARAYLQACRFLTFEVRTYKVSDQDWHVQGIAQLSIPFDCVYNFYRCGLSDVYSQPVYRNSMIKKYTKCCWITNF